VERWAQEREAPPTGTTPIGLGNTSAAETGPELAELGALLRHLFDDKEQLSRIKRKHGLQWIIDELKAEDGHEAVSAAVKGEGRRHPLTTKQVWHRAGMVEALRRDGYTELTDMAKIVAAAHGEGSHDSVRKALGEACRRATKLGITDQIARTPDEDLRPIAEQLLSAAQPGGKKLPKFLALRIRRK
jgi:hypothetical protein